MKGIILAGGSGSQLAPLTTTISKQLLPANDKPMIPHPLSTLMMAGIQDILVTSTPQHMPLFQSLLGDGNQWGLSLHYKVQPNPGGLAEAFTLGEEFIAGESCCLTLGDNLFYGQGLIQLLKRSAPIEREAQVFAYEVRDPTSYGVVSFDKQGKVISLEEKPQKPKSNFAVPGLYFYDSRVCDFAKHLKPSACGELEITDLNRIYLEEASLQVEVFGRGRAWLDTGTQESLYDASSFVGAIEKRTGLKVSCLEEIAYWQGWLTREQLVHRANQIVSTEYGQYLQRLTRHPLTHS